MATRAHYEHLRQQLMALHGSEDLTKLRRRIPIVTGEPIVDKLCLVWSVNRIPLTGG